ncbi:MAG: hypothetical protein KJ949_01305 [Nanoarchaeota archaeon]|nr:hypothetical protein [Nanoarchaeota archaeon]
MLKYSGIDIAYYFVGSVGRGFGTGAIITGLITQDMETILGGIGLVYAGQCLYKSAQDNANAREQTDVLKGIEAKLKE